MEKAQDAMYGTEHSAAWLMALVAIVLGVIGLLVGFDILDFRDGEADVAGLPGNFLDAAMLIFSGITAAVLAWTLHSSDHHRMRNPAAVSQSERGLWSMEHGLAYLMALASIVLVVIGLLTGYGLFDTDNQQLDGLLWIWTGFGAGLLTATLHAVRHHQLVETDEMVRLVTERVRMSQGTATGTATTATEADRRPAR